MLLLMEFLRLAILLQTETEDSSTTVWLCGIIAISYAAAWLGFARQRRGQWHIPAQALAVVLAAGLVQSKRLLTTPARAQFWMERSAQNAAVPLIVAGLGLALFLSFLPQLAQDGDLLPGGIFSVWLFFFSTAATFWAAMSGLLLARDASSNSLSLSQFLAVRPISSGELAWAKIKLSFELTTIGWLAYGAGVSFWFFHVSSWSGHLGTTACCARTKSR